MHSFVLDRFKHCAAEQSLALIQRADLTRGECPLRFLVFEFGTAITKRTKDGIACRAAITWLGLQQALVT
jgi:hypothetical protein